MSATSCVLSVEQFQCSICLDVFTDPVAIPCGHNYCKSCITTHWDVNGQCECPLCKRIVQTRPELHVNTFISEMASQYRQSAVQKTSRRSVKRGSSSGEILCGVCTETKQKALKTCLMCLASYCDTHLEFHQKITGLTKHELIDPVDDLEDRICKNHDRPLEMFCKTDQRCVCISCTELDHKLHCIVPLMEQHEGKMAELRETVADIQKMIEERHMKIQELKQSVKLSREDADQEKSASAQVFTALIRSVEEGLAQLLDLIEEKHKKTEKQAEGFIKELEEELSELTKRGAEVEQLLHTEDHLQFLQNFPSMSPAPPTRDWIEVRVHLSYDGTVRSAVAQIEQTVSEEVEKQLKSELERVQQFAVDVTLDPKTANQSLTVSNDKKRVFYGKRQDNLGVFSQSASLFGKRSFSAGKFYFDIPSTYVFGRESFSEGKFYFEVQVGGKSKWELGVAPESIKRKHSIRPDGQTGPWILALRNGNECKALGVIGIPSLKSKPQKVGVFVDYEEGLISFYDADTALIYSFTGCNFTEKLFPIFAPCDNSSGDNSAPLIITPVNRRLRSKF